MAAPPLWRPDPEPISANPHPVCLALPDANGIAWSMPPDHESALVVPVPAAEPVVGTWRERLDPSCGLGVPAHVTVLYPFVPPDRLDEEVTGELASMLGAVPGFGFRLEEVRWFGDEVAWLRPEPGRPFVRLTEMVTARWPDFQPYEGIHEEVIPHLTVSQDGRSEEALSCVEAVERELPIQTRAEEVWLMTGSREPASWILHTALALAGGDDPPPAGLADRGS